MGKSYLILIFVFGVLLITAQNGVNCFDDANYQRERDLKEGKAVTVGDSATVIIQSMNIAKQKVIGCKFPYAPFITTDKKQLSFDGIKTDYVFVNFNYLYCDACVEQLDSLIEIKNKLKASSAIVSFFSCSKDELQHLINKYKNEVLFVCDADPFTMNFDLKCGRPLNFVLDKRKMIIKCKTYIHASDCSDLMR